MQKKIIRTFKMQRLRIKIGWNMKVVNFLDVTHNLDNASFKPLSKSNYNQTSINVNFNHPRSIWKQTPNTVKKDK